MDTLDLHGIRYEKAKILVEEFVLLHDPPLRIITGNSTKMKEIVDEILKVYYLKSEPENDWNLGSLIVTPL